MGVPRGNFEPLSALSHGEDRRYSRHSQTVTKQPLRACEPVHTFFSFFTQAVREQIDFYVYELKSFFLKQVATSKEDSLILDLDLDQK